MNTALEICTDISCTTIDDLPDEVLIPIFKLLGNGYFENLSLVSNRWKSIIDEDIGWEVFVSDCGNCDASKKHSIFEFWCRTPEQLSEETIQICHVRMIMGPVFPLKKPEKLETLYFKSPLLSYVFKTLTCKAVKLTKLYFLHSSLSSDNLSGAGQLNLPNLKLLHLCDRSLESGDMPHPGFIPNNINFFLQQSFPGLVELVVSTVADRISTKSFGLNLLYFVQNHYSKLRTLKFSVVSTILELQMFMPNLLDQYESIQLSNKERKGLDWKKLKKVMFKTLELDFGKNFVVGLSEWNNILEHQSSFQNLILFKESPTAAPAQLFLNPVSLSHRSLVYLQLGVQIIAEDHSTVPLDCSVFEVCSGLRKLGLCGNGGHDRPLQTELINCHRLPKTILALLLKNITVESRDLNTIIFRLNNIVKLTLDTVGSKDQFGMTFEILDKAMGTVKCREVIVKSFNNINAEEYPDLVDEFARESFTIPNLPNCHFHAKFSDELEQYILICV